MEFNLKLSKYFGPAALFYFFSPAVRKILLYAIYLVVFLLLGILVFPENLVSESVLPLFLFIKNLDESKILGIIYLCLSGVVFLFAIRAFITTFEICDYEDKEIKKSLFSKNLFDYFDFEAFLLIFRSSKIFGRDAKNLTSFDILSNIFKSDFLRVSFLRLGITEDIFKKLLENYKKEEPVFFMEIFNAPQNANEKAPERITLQKVIMAIFEEDSQFNNFLFSMNIHKAELENALDWMRRVFKEEKLNKAWWRKENLLKIPAVGRQWQFGGAYYFNKYSSDLMEEAEAYKSHTHFYGRSKEIESLEHILSRSHQANAILIGEPGVGKSAVIFGFARNVFKTSNLHLKNKHLMKFNWQRFLGDMSLTPENFENGLFKVLNGIADAGNIIPVIDDFPEFLESSKKNAKVSVEKILEPYLSGSAVQFIAISDEASFKRGLEFYGSLMKFFEPIYVKEPQNADLENIIEDAAMHLEGKSKSFIAYEAIKEIVNSSQKYILEGALPERAIDLLEDVGASKTGGLILGSDVLKVVREKTQMPVGEITKGERETFLNLEDELHKRIINQEEAIKYLASSLKRSRTEIQDSGRPMGSFLFLGPTGVGKTETAKALSDIYFGKDRFLRFDMSEYSEENSFSRLIGNFEKNIQGDLASKIHENPYSLLLLDEFEKAHYKIGNLFLQILEDGFFTDAFGKKAHMRNSIIIATSNAGANLIFELLGQNIDPTEIKEKVIDKIRAEGFFKPELLNRFDGVVIFHPLSEENLKKVANLMLLNLQKSLKEKDLFLEIDENLVSAVAKWGYSPQFGARPMRRAIQDKIEKNIADRILKEELKRGSSIKFTSEELEKM